MVSLAPSGRRALRVRSLRARAAKRSFPPSSAGRLRGSEVPLCEAKHEGISSRRGALRGPTIMAENPTFTARKAVELLDSVQGYEEGLRRRTWGVNWMI